LAKVQYEPYFRSSLLKNNTKPHKDYHVLGFHGQYHPLKDIIVISRTAFNEYLEKLFANKEQLSQDNTDFEDPDEKQRKPYTPGVD
jgi:hypothetical protein